MAKWLKKVFSFFLVLCVVINPLAVQALADEQENADTDNPTLVLNFEPAPEEEIDLEPILESNLTVEGGEIDVDDDYISWESEDENGNTVVTEELTTTTEGVLDNGNAIEGQETYTEKTTLNPQGDEIQVEAVLEGHETETEIIEDDTSEKHLTVEVEVELIPGEPTKNSETESEPDVESGKPNGSEYDIAQTTTTTERTVQATTERKEVEVEATGDSVLTPLIPDRTIADQENLDDEQLLEQWTYSGGFNKYPATEAPEGYDYRLAGFGQMSEFYVGVDTETEEEEGEEYISGALQFELEYDPDFVPGSEDNKEITDKDIVTTYCADLRTMGKDDFWYRIDSLEDAGYYDEEDAAYIRAIALNGYWGTSNEPDENGEYAEGSLERLKQDMKDALRAGKLTGITEEEIDTITQGQAINGTQSAIWVHSNDGTDEWVDQEELAVTGFAGHVPTEDDVRNVNAIFDYLMGLDPADEEVEITEVIDQDAFIVEDSMSIVVGEKVADAEENADANEDNDVFNVDLQFALVVTPSDEGDDLIVQVVRGVDADGNPIIAAQGRIAGGNKEEDAANGFNEVVYDEETDSYTLRDLVLAENAEFDFDLKLVGTQYLEHGVYLFTSEVRNGVSSQTMLGVMEGDKEVNVSQGFVICFDVDEQTIIETEHFWREEIDPIYTPVIYVEEPPRNDPPPREAPAPRVTYRLSRNVGQLETIVDEEVPLAEVPQTGDVSMVWFAMVLVAGMGLCMLKISEKKCRA